VCHQPNCTTVQKIQIRYIKNQSIIGCEEHYMTRCTEMNWWCWWDKTSSKSGVVQGAPASPLLWQPFLIGLVIS